MRDIQDVLFFRNDLSPFLVHLTRNQGGNADEAAERLITILQERRLVPGPGQVSDARFGGNTFALSEDQRRTFFGAVCLTETPLNEIHCLLEIEGREVNMQPFGLVFMRDRLRRRNVSPVVYLNNVDGKADEVVYGLFSLIQTHVLAAERLLPLISGFGKKIWPPGAQARPDGVVDWYWEREWRYPRIYGDLEFTDEDVFCGLCPHNLIEGMEQQFPPIKFIDPRRNMKWYAQSLIESRQRLDIGYSVV